MNNNMTIHETLLFACANDPDRIIELIQRTWDRSIYKEIFEDNDN